MKANSFRWLSIRPQSWHPSLRTTSAALLITLCASMPTVFADTQKPTGASSALPNIELSYLKALHERGEDVHPTTTPLLMSLFINAHREAEGIQFFAQIRPRFDGASATIIKTAEAVLRASQANEIFLLKRKAWVEQTVRMFNETRDAEPDNLLNRWMIGTTLAQLPRFIGQFDEAQRDLEWVLDRLDQIPRDGLLPGAQREVYFQLARLHNEADEPEKARQMLARSGYTSFEPTLTVRSQFAADLDKGLTMSIQKIVELVPAKVYAARGFEMMDFHFVVSANGKELISIDAGTRTESAKRAHQALMAKHPELPKLSTVLITHAHWDHIGGHQYFRQLNPDIVFISRDNYHEETASIADAEPKFQYFFSRHYSRENVRSFEPNITIPSEVARTARVIGGSRFEFIPIPGGETKDGMFIHMPEIKTVFVGDFIMPYIGAPFANEGDPDGLLKSIDILATLDARHELHGHTPLTMQFTPSAMLTELKPALEQLIQHTQQHKRKGKSREQIQQTNFIPDAVFANTSMQVPYLVIRDGLISRIYEQSTGYWQANLDGMDALTHRDIGLILTKYLELSEDQITSALRELLADGQHEAALQLATWAETAQSESETIRRMRMEALTGLREKHQFTSPFKFLIYSEAAGISIPQLAPASP